MENAPLATYFIPMLLAAALPCRAADLWISSRSPAVTAKNDCGHVAFVTGTAGVARAFGAGEAGLDASDRIYAGDEIATAGDSLVEIVCGYNSALLVGPDSRVRIAGLSLIPGEDGKQYARLEAALLAGSVRAEARLNRNAPELILLAVGDGELLLARGDCAASGTKDWRAAVILGAAEFRSKRGDAAGAPMALAAGALI